MPITRRYIHSFFSASKYYGLDNLTLTKYVTAAGIGRRERPDDPKSRMLLDVEDTEKLFGGKSGMQTALKAGKPWNVPEIEMYRLADAGILKPVMPADRLMEGARQFFRETDVKTVLDGLFAKAETLYPHSDRGQSIRYVARRSIWSSAAIVQAAIDGRIWLGLVGEHRDFGQLQVDMSELKELDRQQAGDLVLFHDAVQVLQCGVSCLRDLIKLGHLSGGKMRNWQTGRWCHAVPASVLVDFKTQLMSLHELKLALKTDRAHALVWAVELAIPAKIDVGPYSKFYPREAVARHL